MHIVKVLIGNTLQKELRSKTLFFLLVFTLGVIFLVSAAFKFMFDFSEADTGKQMISGFLGEPFTIFYYVISVWNGILAIILGVNCIRSDERCSVLPQLLALPIKRFDYLFARIMGSWMIILGYYIFSLCLGGAIFFITLKTFTFNPSVFLSLFFSSFSMLFIIIMSAFLSLHMPKLMAFIGALFVNSFISLSNAHFIKYSFAESLEGLNFLKVLGLFFYWLFPRVGNVNDFASTMMTGNEFAGNALVLYGHFSVTLAVFVLIFLYFFKKKEI